MTNCSSILVCKTTCTEKPGEIYSPWGYKELDTTEHMHTNTHTHTRFPPNFISDELVREHSLAHQLGCTL